MEFGLIGEKLTHSYSAEIHRVLGDYEYTLNEVPKDEFENFIKSKNYQGLNITIPYKKTVMPFLDEIDKTAKEIGAVNTVINKNGRLIGANTDALGLKSLIEYGNIDISGQTVLICGTGGTSNTAEYVVKSMSAKKVLKCSRSEKENAITYLEAYTKYKDEITVIINTTPVGMFPDIDAIPVDLSAFPNLKSVVDVVYNPLKTKLILKAEELKITAVGGLYMLVSQAVFASKMFTGKNYSQKEIEKVYLKLLNSKQNFVLIGMPGSGKTTLGKKISELTGKTFFDTDAEIKIKFNKTPAEIISEQGEKAFRDIEERIIKELSVKNSCVIATGGGAVLRKHNIENLKANGKIIFLDREIDNIIPTSDRPLSSDRKKLEKLYAERFELYKTLCDVRVQNNASIADAVNLILKN